MREWYWEIKRWIKRPKVMNKQNIIHFKNQIIDHFAQQEFTHKQTDRWYCVVFPAFPLLSGWAVLAGNRWQPDNSVHSLRLFFITFKQVWGKYPAASAMLIRLPAEFKASSSNIWTHRLLTSLCQDDEVLCAPKPNLRGYTLSFYNPLIIPIPTQF